MSENKLLKDINETIESLRVFINNDGGDLTFVSFVDQVLTLRISGACVGCQFIGVTFDQGVKEVFLTEFPGEIKEVKFVTSK
ncbi:MAG: NifU family protein [Mycoplasmataceae bacterium]|jgi:Fe-S cluster biogenesis protein NfuA|nr:NifU family protein [Mycoplasmataceae bacterium]